MGTRLTRSGVEKTRGPVALPKNLQDSKKTIATDTQKKMYIKTLLKL
jgi:hypothetical protein